MALAACSGPLLGKKPQELRARQCFAVVSSLHSDLARSEVMASVSETQAILLVHGPDRKGIVAAFSQTLFGHGCGIVSSEQHTDAESSVFYQRIVFDASELHTDRVSLRESAREERPRDGRARARRGPDHRVREQVRRLRGVSVSKLPCAKRASCLRRGSRRWRADGIEVIPAERVLESTASRHRRAAAPERWGPLRLVRDFTKKAYTQL